MKLALVFATSLIIFSCLHAEASRLSLVAMRSEAIENQPTYIRDEVLKIRGRLIGDFDLDGRSDFYTKDNSGLSIRLASGAHFEFKLPTADLVLTEVEPVSFGTDNQTSFVLSVVGHPSGDDWTKTSQYLIFNTGGGRFETRELTDIFIKGRGVSCAQLPMARKKAICMFASYSSNHSTYNTLIEIGPGGAIRDVTKEKGLPWKGAKGTDVSGDKRVNGKHMMGFSFTDINNDGLPDLVGGGQHSQLMYTTMIREGANYRFEKAKWFDLNNEYMGVSGFKKNHFNFPCVYVKIEAAENRKSPFGDYLTCYDAAKDIWTQQTMPRKLTDGTVIEQYVMNTRRARMVNADDAIYIEAKVRIAGGEVIQVFLRARPGTGAPAIVPEVLNTHVFSPEFYMTKYASLNDAFNGNAELVTNHWLNHGIQEGRQGSKYFSSTYYIARYPDIEKYANGDRRKAISHWIRHGRAEHRQGVEDQAK